MDFGSRSRAFGYLSLFTSFGTLVCCALPALLVLAGLGSTVAAVLSTAPWLVTLSRHKAWVFGVAGALIAASFFHVYRVAPRFRAGGEACPPGASVACGLADRVSRILLWVSACVYLAGFLAAYVLGPLLTWSG